MLATPWNFSYKTLEVFLLANNYFEKELEGVKKGLVLTRFIDHVLRSNASNWIHGMAFMDSAKLSWMWANWWNTRKASMPAITGKKDDKKDRGKENMPRYSGPPSKDNIFKFWHEGRCKNSPSGKVRLYHRCDVDLVDAAGKTVVDPSTGKPRICGGIHKRADHK